MCLFVILNISVLWIRFWVFVINVDIVWVVGLVNKYIVLGFVLGGFIWLILVSCYLGVFCKLKIIVWLVLLLMLVIR